MSKDSKMYYLDQDIQKIQVKTNMYINEYGSAGAFHLAREIIQNNFDECLDDDSPGNYIEISYDKSTGILRSEDNGRGFNEKDFPMSIFVTTLQSGSKFFRSSGAASAGEFGVGLTVVNALSDVFKISSYREIEKTVHTLEYHEGLNKKDEIKKLKGQKQHGVIVEFRASEKYMGKDCAIPIDDVVNWIDSLFYLDSDRLSKRKITCRLDVFDGLKLEKTYKFKPKAFSDLLTKLVPVGIKKKDLSSTTAFNRSTFFTEDSKMLVVDEDGKTSVDYAKEEKEIHMDIAFLYGTSIDMNDIATYDTYCNYTNTIENGVHLEAFDEAFCRFMQNKINNSLSDAQKTKLKVTWDDIRTNLFCVLNLSTNAHVGFVGNAKQKIDNRELIPYMKELVTEGLEEFFKDSPSILNEYLNIIKMNAKARIEAQKVKVASQKERMDSMKEHSMKNYIRCNNTGKQFKELFLVEGDSASGSARNGCDPDTQAFLMFRGVTANAWKCSYSEIMANNEWKTYVNVTRCGAGPTFDLNKLYFNRINIFTAADIDGSNIAAGMLAFVYRYQRPIIEAGKLYRVYSPLYALDDKDHPYVANKTEMIELYHDKIVKTYKIKLVGDDDYLSKDELYDFLIDTYDYRENLVRSADESGRVNKFLVEIIIASLTILGVVNSQDDYKDIETTFSNQKFIKTIMSNIQKKFKEITVDNTGRFSGIVDGKYVIIKTGKRFFKKTSDLIPIYKKYGYKITVSEKGKDPKEMSIGEFLDDCQKLYPKIKTRFKGLGELNGKQLKETTLDINHRISVQYTIEDVERELAMFDITHGASKKNSLDRKEMMKSYKIRREDLDN